MYNWNWNNSAYHPFAITSIRIEKVFYRSRKILERRSKTILKARQVILHYKYVNRTSRNKLLKKMTESSSSMLLLFMLSAVQRCISPRYWFLYIISISYCLASFESKLQGFDILHPELFHFCLVVGLVQNHQYPHTTVNPLLHDCIMLCIFSF